MPERRPALRAAVVAASLSLVPVPPLSVTPQEPIPASGQGSDQGLERYRRALDFPELVRGGRVEPHWLPGGDAFWYEATGGIGGMAATASR